MTTFKNAMEVFTLLPKTNCRKCSQPTCLAFAAAVFQGRSSLRECPFVDREILESHGDNNSTGAIGLEQDFQNVLSQLQENIKQSDLQERAAILGGKFANNQITLKILGKDFSVDANGNIYTLLHVNQWLTIPVFQYILQSKGLPLAHSWVPFRELETSKDWARFFEHQCVALLKKIADANSSFFNDIIELFNAKQVENHYDADISLIIEPLPLLPILICYNNPEDGLESDLNLFFDNTADKNLPVESIYTLITGLARMLKRLAETHG